MYKKTITYTDYNGVERTEDFYFNLTKAELRRRNYSTKGGFQEYVNKIINEKNSKELEHLFENLILESFGVKSEDGRRFIKSEELKKEFSETEAFSELYMELAGDENAASAFVNGILPKIPETNKSAPLQPSAK